MAMYEEQYHHINKGIEAVAEYMDTPQFKNVLGSGLVKDYIDWDEIANEFCNLNAF